MTQAGLEAGTRHASCEARPVLEHDSTAVSAPGVRRVRSFDSGQDVRKMSRDVFARKELENSRPHAANASGSGHTAKKPGLIVMASTDSLVEANSPSTLGNPRSELAIFGWKDLRMKPAGFFEGASPSPAVGGVQAIEAARDGEPAALGEIVPVQRSACARVAAIGWGRVDPSHDGVCVLQSHRNVTKPIGGELAVGVGERDELASRGRKASISRQTGSEPALVEGGEAEISADLGGSVGGSVVYDENLHPVGGIVLLHQGTETGADLLRLVANRNDHRNREQGLMS